MPAPSRYRRSPAWVAALPKAQPEAILSDPEIEGILLNHLWRPAYNSCLCGERSPAKVGGHYIWWAAHVRASLRSSGWVTQ